MRWSEHVILLHGNGDGSHSSQVFFRKTTIGYTSTVTKYVRKIYDAAECSESVTWKAFEKEFDAHLLWPTHAFMFKLIGVEDITKNGARTVLRYLFATTSRREDILQRYPLDVGEECSNMNVMMESLMVVVTTMKESASLSNGTNCSWDQAVSRAMMDLCPPSEFLHCCYEKERLIRTSRKIYDRMREIGSKNTILVSSNGHFRGAQRLGCAYMNVRAFMSGTSLDQIDKCIDKMVAAYIEIQIALFPPCMQEMEDVNVEKFFLNISAITIHRFIISSMNTFEGKMQVDSLATPLMNKVMSLVGNDAVGIEDNVMVHNFLGIPEDSMTSLLDLVHDARYISIHSKGIESVIPTTHPCFNKVVDLVLPKAYKDSMEDMATLCRIAFTKNDFEEDFVLTNCGGGWVGVFARYAIIGNGPDESSMILPYKEILPVTISVDVAQNMGTGVREIMTLHMGSCSIPSFTLNEEILKLHCIEVLSFHTIQDSIYIDDMLDMQSLRNITFTNCTVVGISARFPLRTIPIVLTLNCCWIRGLRNILAMRSTEGVVYQMSCFYLDLPVFPTNVDGSIDVAANILGMDPPSVGSMEYYTILDKIVREQRDLPLTSIVSLLLPFDSELFEDMDTRANAVIAMQKLRIALAEIRRSFIVRVAIRWMIYVGVSAEEILSVKIPQSILPRNGRMNDMDFGSVLDCVECKEEEGEGLDGFMCIPRVCIATFYRSETNVETEIEGIDIKCMYRFKGRGGLMERMLQDASTDALTSFIGTQATMESMRLTFAPSASRMRDHETIEWSTDLTGYACHISIKDVLRLTGKELRHYLYDCCTKMEEDLEEDRNSFIHELQHGSLRFMYVKGDILKPLTPDYENSGLLWRNAKSTGKFVQPEVTPAPPKPSKKKKKKKKKKKSEDQNSVDVCISSLPTPPKHFHPQCPDHPGDPRCVPICHPWRLDLHGIVPDGEEWRRKLDESLFWKCL